MKIFLNLFKCCLLGMVSIEARSVAATFHFRTPEPAVYQVHTGPSATRWTQEKAEWLRARPSGRATNTVELGRRVVIQLSPAGDLRQLTAGGSLRLSRTVSPNVFILQAPDAWTAAREADRLAALPGVLASYPILRREVALNGPYAYKPSATYFNLYQYYLENRFQDGTPRGVDINVRAAWPWTRGAGMIVAVGDTGFELEHPNLVDGATGAPHYNFEIASTNGAPPTPASAHGTAVAGLIAARSTNPLSLLGVAPESKLASWVVIGTNGMLVGDEQLMDAFQYQSNFVQVQNHSWGNPGDQLFGPTLLAGIGISNAIAFGRDGRGVIMVRAAGNRRVNGGNANDDAYCSDPRVIGVASVRVGGRAASYSNPGACLLVSAVGGDPQDGAWEITTDRQGPAGYSAFQLFTDTNFWNFYPLFYGTSAAAPQIAGLAALLLSVNTNLTYRDVQQILILSARHYDFLDPDLTTNAAGLLISHNDGFGVPDAGRAVQLARRWVNRPAATRLTVTSSNTAAIPDDGLRVLVTGSDIPGNSFSIRTLPGTGPHADVPTMALPLVDVGLATNVLGVNLTNKAALIERGVNNFDAKINLAAQAGAAFAVVYNFATNTSGSGAPGGDQLIPMGGTDFVPIPAVFVGHRDGQALQALFQTNASALAQIHLNSTNYTFSVTNTLLCEHVGLRVVTDHPLRGDLRLTLVSPAGTRSVLQRYNADITAGPADWTYYSTHHFYESSAGNWTAYFSDEGEDNTGAVQQVSLLISGVPILDSDQDGLDDGWEMMHFGGLGQGQNGDPDHDGNSNLREQIMGTDPNVMDVPFELDLSRWNEDRVRLSWPGLAGYTYQVFGGTNVASVALITNVPGRFPETEWFTSSRTLAAQFFRVQAVPNP